VLTILELEKNNANLWKPYGAGVGTLYFSKLDILKNQFSKVFSKFHVQRLALHLVIVINILLHELK